MATINPADIEREFRDKVCAEIRLLPEGLRRYQVLQPFTFDDGDHYVVVLKNTGGDWWLTDEAHTLMHLSYEDIDLSIGGYATIIDNVVTAFGIENREGELVLPVPERRFGDALFSFIQALVKISDIKYLQRERIRSLFMEEFRAFIGEIVPEGLRQFDYHDPRRDPDRVYTVDCRIDAIRRPLFVFGITTDGKCQTVTNIIYWWERQQEPFDVMAVFENQQEIGRPILARFSDVCGRQFSGIHPNRDRIGIFLRESFDRRIAVEWAEALLGLDS